MKILPFPARPGAVRDLAVHVASVEKLLLEWRTRQSSLSEDGRRLRVSLDRLSSLSKDLLRNTASLRRSAVRLRGCHRRLGPAGPNS